MQSQKRILHIKNSLSYDGATVIEYRFAEILKKDVIFDWFLISDEIGVFEDRFKDLGSYIFHSSSFSGEYGTKSPLLIFYYFLKENHYTCVYFDTDFSGRSIWLLIARFAGVPHRIIHAHNSQTEGGINPILHWIFKQIMFISVTDYLACSKKAADWLFPRKKARGAVIIRNGINTSDFKYNVSARNRIRKIWNIPDSAYVIGHVGRFCKMKNHNKILGVFCEFLKLYPNSFLFLIGNGELFEDIERQVNELNLNNYVKFIGNTDEVAAYLSSMDIFILPSLFEGLGISAVEAECSGLNVYVSDGVPDEAILTDKAIQISLHQNNEYWAKRIAFDVPEIDLDSRVKYADKIQQTGFDINDSTKYLLQILSTI